jgi:hypothetical protein
MSPRRRRRLATYSLAGVLILLGFCLYPSQTVTVPSWHFQVVDLKERPLAGLPVEQFWHDNSGELRFHNETQTTDADGRISFPERRLKTVNIRRVLLRLPVLLSGGIHANFGSSLSLAVLCESLVIAHAPFEYDVSILPSKLVVIYQPSFIKLMPGYIQPRECATLAEQLRTASL